MLMTVSSKYNEIWDLQSEIMLHVIKQTLPKTVPAWQSTSPQWHLIYSIQQTLILIQAQENAL